MKGLFFIADDLRRVWLIDWIADLGWRCPDTFPAEWEVARGAH